MDTTLHASYDDMGGAQQATQQLLAIEIDHHAIRLLSASGLSSPESEHVGGYADSGDHMHGGARYGWQLCKPCTSTCA
jgi:hypothetical protein